MSKSKPFVSADCDTLVFSSAAAVESRTIEVLHQPTGKSKRFQNRTEFKEVMKSKNKEITQDYIIKDIQEAEDVSHALKLVKNAVEQIYDNFSDCEVVLSATAENNFRDSLPYPTKYKGNRSTMLRPLLLKDAQNYLLTKYKARRAIGCEVDDYTAILAYEALEQGREAFLLSPDGDSRQFDGLKLGKYNSKPSDCVHIQFMHEVDWNDKGFQSYGFPWMTMQHLTGDVSDGLKPTYLSNARYGEKGCFNDLKKLKTPEEFVEFTIKKYKEWYPKPFEYVDWKGGKVNADWKYMLELYWMGTTMMRKEGVLPNYWDFLEQKGIKYDNCWG